MLIDRELTGFPEGRELNYAQELAHAYIDKDVNLVMLSNTNTGKSTIPVMFAHRHLKKGWKMIYVAPMKSLVEEKKRDWMDKDHPFSKYKITIITGDYAASTADTDAEEADIIVITPESLASRLRNAGTQPSWMDDVAFVCVDEVHLLGEKGRGATLEVSLIEFTYRCPDAQLLLMSGTVPNHNEITQWVDTLNNLKTVCINTNWRAVQLEHHYIRINATKVDDKYKEKLDRIKELLTKYPEDQFLVVVGSKSFGRKLEYDLKTVAPGIEFHNADKDVLLKERIEKSFRAGTSRVLLCTTTLTTGLNMPARRVIIADHTIGIEEAPSSALNQAAGRAGRAGVHDKGDAYFLLPNNKFDYHVARIKAGENVISQLRTVPEVALHFLGAMRLGRIRKHEDFYSWFGSTLKSHQSKMTREKQKVFLEGIIDELIKMRMIIEDEDGTLTLKKLGTVCTQMAIDPYYANDLVIAFSKINTKKSYSNIDLANALGGCRVLTQNKFSQSAATSLPTDCQKIFGTTNVYPSIYYLMFEGRADDVGSMLSGAMWQLRSDLGRVSATLGRIGTECYKWDNIDTLTSLPRRAQGYNPQVALLMSQAQISATKAKALIKEGITDIRNDRKNPAKRNIINKIVG